MHVELAHEPIGLYTINTPISDRQASVSCLASPKLEFSSDVRADNVLKFKVGMPQVIWLMGRSLISNVIIMYIGPYLTNFML